MELIPRNDWLLLEGFPDEVRNAPINPESRIIVPDCAREPSRLSKVLAIGPKVSQDGSVKVGDTVLTKRYGGAESKDAKGERFFFMRLEEVDAKVTNA